MQTISNFKRMNIQMRTIFNFQTGLSNYIFTYNYEDFQLIAEPVHSSNKDVIYTLCDATGQNITTLIGEKLIIYSFDIVTASDFWQRMELSLRLTEKINHLRIEALELKNKLLDLKYSQAIPPIMELFKFITLANEIHDAVLTSLTGLTQNQIVELNDWKNKIDEIKLMYKGL